MCTIEYYCDNNFCSGEIERVESLKSAGITTISKRQENALVESPSLKISEKPSSPTCDQLFQLKNFERNEESSISIQTIVGSGNERLSCPIFRPVSRDDALNENMAIKVPTHSSRDVCLESNPSVSLSPKTVFDEGKHKAALSKLLASPSRDIQYLNSNGNREGDIQVMSVSPSTALDDQKREAALQLLLATQSDEVP